MGKRCKAAFRLNRMRLRYWWRMLHPVFLTKIPLPNILEKLLLAGWVVFAPTAITIGMGLTPTDYTPTFYWFGAAAVSTVVAVFLWDEVLKLQGKWRVIFPVMAVLVVLLSVWRADAWVLRTVEKAGSTSEAQAAADSKIVAAKAKPIIQREVILPLPAEQHETKPEVKVTAQRAAIPQKPSEADKPPTLIDLFNTDFSSIGGVSDNGFNLSSTDGEVIHIGRRIYLDFPAKSEFIGFYIPSSRKGFEACLALVDIVQPMITDLPNRIDVAGGDAGGVTRLRELTFSGRVFLYHEWPLSNKQKADLTEAYSAKGLDVQFRGTDYLKDQVIAWNQEHGARKSH